jgi:hypothetical protein
MEQGEEPAHLPHFGGQRRHRPVRAFPKLKGIFSAGALCHLTGPILGETEPYQDVTRQFVAQVRARNVLISNWLSETVTLATNQGVVGSNPAGSAKFRYKFNGLRVGRPFSWRCAIGPVFDREWRDLRMKRLGPKGFALLSVDAAARIVAAVLERSSCTLRELRYTDRLSSHASFSGGPVCVPGLQTQFDRHALVADTAPSPAA